MKPPLMRLFNEKYFFLFLHSYVFSAPGTLLESLPGTLMLTDCLEACQSNDTCGSVNYETGLCVLFSSNADKLPGKSDKFYIFAGTKLNCAFIILNCSSIISI